jgi:hypothetical protein
MGFLATKVNTLFIFAVLIDKYERQQKAKNFEIKGLLID